METTKKITMEKVKAILKKTTIIYKMLLVIGIFLIGCYSALIIEYGTDKFLVIGLLASVIFSILNIICNKLVASI